MIAGIYRSKGIFSIHATLLVFASLLSSSKFRLPAFTVVAHDIRTLPPKQMRPEAGNTKASQLRIQGLRFVKFRERSATTTTTLSVMSSLPLVNACWHVRPAFLFRLSRSARRPSDALRQE
eukprot:2138139-Rhodomonas_salina.1